MEEEAALPRVDELATARREIADLKQVLVQTLLHENLEWDDLPQGFQDDRDLVTAAVRGEKVNWYTLPKRWKADVGVAIAAMQAQPKPIGGRVLPGTCKRKYPVVAWKDLPMNCKTNLDVATAALLAEGGPIWEELPVWLRGDPDLMSFALQRGRLRWEDVPTELRGDPDVMFLALKRGRILWEDVPTELQQNHRDIAFYGVKHEQISADDCPCLDPAFFRDAIEEDKIDWNLLPTELRNDTGFARSITRFTNTVTARKILNHFPELHSDRTFWLRMLDLVPPSDGDIDHFNSLPRLLRDFASPEIFADREIMQRECIKYADVVTLVHPTLGNDRDFLAAVLNQNPGALQHVSHVVQLLYPDLVVGALAPLGRIDYSDCMDHSFELLRVERAIAPSFWEDRSFVLSWVKAGLGFPPVELFPREVRMMWTVDKELFYLTAKHSESKVSILAFERWADASLRNDKPFMLQVVQCKPALFDVASENLQRDLDLAITAFAGPSALAEEHMTRLHFNGLDDVVNELVRSIRERLDWHDTFVATLLRGMSASPTNSTASTPLNLSLLNQGAETSVVYKKLIADFLNVPTGSELRLLRRAHEHVCDAIALW